jgi:hypothetical protein
MQEPLNHCGNDKRSRALFTLAGESLPSIP